MAHRPFATFDWIGHQLVRGAAVLAIQDGTEQISKDLLGAVPVDHAAQRATSTRSARRGKAKATT